MKGDVSIKIIFLDIDGVLNGYGKVTGVLYWIFKRLHLLKFVRRHYDLFGVRTHKVKLLSKIVKRTKSNVVISSSWRFGWYAPYENKGERQKQLHDKLHKYNINVIGITDRVDGHRESEIRKWLVDNKDLNIKSFVVLDDEKYDLQGFIGKELVLTSKVRDIIRGNWYEDTGLKRKHVKQAVNILNKFT